MNASRRPDSLRAVLASGALAAAALLAIPALPGARSDANAQAPASPESTATDAELRASSAPAWVPDRTVRSEAAWETALRLPMRIATLPLTIAGQGLERTLVTIEEASLVPRVAVIVAGLPKIGLTLGPASLGDRTGLGGRVGYRPPTLAGALGVEFSGSLSKYARTRVGVGFGPAEIAYAYDWRPRERFFGYGLASADDRPSTYAVRSQDIGVALAYPWRARHRPPPREQIRIWAGARESRLLGGRENPSFETVSAAAAPLFGERQEHVHYGARLSTDRRTGQPHWSRGGRLALAIERFTDTSSDLLAIRTPRGDSPEFTRLGAEVEGGISWGADPRTIRLSLRAVNQSGDDATIARLLPHDLQRLGGGAGLAGFEPGRFHDVDLVAGKLTYLFPLSRNLELDLHVEAGGVYGRLEDATLGSLESSYGIALRPRLDTAPLASIGVDWSAEGARVRYSFGGVE